MIRTTIFTNLLLGGALWGQSAVSSQPGAQPAALASTQAPLAAAAKPAPAVASYRNQPTRMTKRAAEFYGLVWGVDSLIVRTAESGELVRFSYRVLDAEKAKVLNDKKVEPSLIDPDKGIKLVIPSLEKVGQLRQTATPEAGKSYWMAFSNPGRPVKRGDRVDVVIGNFRAQGLIVE